MSRPSERIPRLALGLDEAAAAVGLSRDGLERYVLETRNRSRRLRVEVSAPRETLVGVTYDDPDGEQAWCYNSEVASLDAWVWDRARGGGGARWLLRDTLRAPGTAHVEYAQRAPVEGVPVLV